MTIASTRREIERFGWASALGALGLRALDRAADFHVLRAIGVARVCPERWQPPARYSHGFLDAGTLHRLARDPQNHLPADFVEDALSHGDRCYGFVEGDVLASFGWHSLRPTPLEHGLVFHAGPRQIYRYNCYTRPEHRGQRLDAAGAMHALDAMRTLDGARTGLVGYVDEANLASRRSWRRMGGADLGAAYVLRAGARCFLHLDAGCLRHGLRIELAAAEVRPTPSRKAA